jgi:DNA-binding NtrC family response regulator
MLDRNLASVWPPILVIDDDPVFRETLCAVLGDAFDVDAASSARKAMDLMSNKAYRVVCSDLVMPGMNGLELLDWVSRSQPTVGRVLLTGAADFSRHAPEAIRRHRVFLKPFDPESFIESIQKLATTPDSRPIGRAAVRSTAGNRRKEAK